MNGVSIKADIRMAIKSYRKGEFGYFGYYLGTILELASRPIEEETNMISERDSEDVFTRTMVTDVA